MSLVHPDDRELVRKAIETVLQSKSEASVEYRVVGPDGHLRWMSSRGRIQLNAAGEPDRLMGVTMEITEGKIAELALRARQERLSAAVEVADLGFYELHGVGRREFFDGLIRSILGLPDAAVPNAREFWVAHLHPEDRERILDLSRQVFEGPLNHAIRGVSLSPPAAGLGLAEANFEGV